jgi:hypothetical protein
VKLVKLVTVPNTLTLILAVVAGVLLYLNQNVLGLPAVWYQAMKYGVLVISAYGVTPAVGGEIGVDIQILLHLSKAVVNLLLTAAVVLAATVSTFGISGVAAGIVLGVTAFVLTIFGPYDGPLPVTARPGVARG